jgi:hypothetical protein
LKAETKRLLSATVHTLERALEEGQRVDQPVPELGTHRRARGDLETTLLQREEARAELAAIDRRDLSGLERIEGTGVVPVEEMPSVTLETFETVQAVRET